MGATWPREVLVYRLAGFSRQGERGQSSASAASIDSASRTQVPLSDRRITTALQRSSLALCEPAPRPTRGIYEPALVVADWLDLSVFGRAVDFRARRAGFFGRPRPMLNANSRRCWA